MLHSLYLGSFPTLIVDDQFILREQLAKDAPAFFEYYANPAVGRYILASKPVDLADAMSEIHYCYRLFHEKRGICWTLAQQSNDVMIGTVGLYINNQNHRAEICYDLAEPYWRQGIMTRALNRVIAYCFNEAEIHRIEAVTLKINTNSIALLKKLGFAFEGSLKNYRYYNGRSHDVEMFALTPDMTELSSAKSSGHFANESVMISA